ncbi:MAG TPA: PEP-CTERM sorting domain-containing protein [Caulobacteraceae bacterium]|nr:PEP-CTERM sorting domain-containing protein [Caulobacteraceae bacterium]
MRRVVLQSLILLAFAGPAAATTKVPIGSDLKFIEAQAQKTAASLQPGAYPRSGGQTGTWKTVTASDWTSGFFPGELWLLYQATGSATWRNDAQAWTAPLVSQATRTDTPDIGFMIGESFGNGYRLTGEAAYKTEILTAAASLATRFNPTVGAFRSRDFGPWSFPVIIDNMPSLGPLQWGAANGGAAAWGAEAATHAQTTLTYMVRGDGSTDQLANFDPTTGAFLYYDSTGGLSPSSTWSRGQAWGLLGFAQAYAVTRNPADLAAAEHIAGFFFGHLPSDYVPYWDFNATVTPTTPRDTSAAAIGADGLVMLSYLAATSGQRNTYLAESEDILGSLSAAYLAPSSSEAVLIDGSGDVPKNSEIDTSLIYGDYFFTESLLRLRNRLAGRPSWLLYTKGALTIAAPLASRTAVPEPSAWALMAFGFANLGLAMRRTRRCGLATAPA